MFKLLLKTREGGRTYALYECLNCSTTKKLREDSFKPSTACNTCESLAGKVFGKLTAIEATTTRKSGCVVWNCLCECGNTTTARSAYLKSGKKKSCGCLVLNPERPKKAPVSESLLRTKRIWSGAKTRVFNKNSKGYSHYGAKGLTISEAWLDFETFLADMGEAPKGLTLERVENSVGYCKENCVWADRRQQAVNRSTTLQITYRGFTKPLPVWCNELRLNSSKIYQRLVILKWSPEKAFETP